MMVFLATAVGSLPFQVACHSMPTQAGAPQTAVQYLEDEEQMHKLYWQRAQAYRAAQQYPQAERTLLAIRRWDAAAEMYKAAAMYSDYLRLMKQSPENLGAAQLWVAQQLEMEGHHRCSTYRARHRAHQCAELHEAALPHTRVQSKPTDSGLRQSIDMTLYGFSKRCLDLEN